MSGPITLASKEILPRNFVKSANARGHLTIAHGLLGNCLNWSTAGRYLAEHPSLKEQLSSMTSLDMRNHGNSAHTPTHTNALMASDVEYALMRRIQTDLQLDDRQVVIGHSMGGMMTMGMLLRRYNEAALLPETTDESLFSGWKGHTGVSEAMRLTNKSLGYAEEFPLQSSLFYDTSVLPNSEKVNGRVTAAVVVDTTPVITLSDDVHETLGKLCKVNMAAIHSYGEAEKELVRVGLDDKSMRDFFTTNIVVNSKDTSAPARWRCNLPVLAAYTDQIRATISEWFMKDGPHQPKPCTLPVLFVFGGDSVYNRKETRDLIPRFFPNSQQVVVENAGHFVHHQKPKEFANLVAPFVAKHLKA